MSDKIKTLLIFPSVKIDLNGKSYSYFMVPYIVADNPELPASRIFEISKKRLRIVAVVSGVMPAYGDARAADDTAVVIDTDRTLSRIAHRDACAEGLAYPDALIAPDTVFICEY